MTLIVALQGKDGLVLAGDSRGTIGDPRGLTAINDTQIKLFQLSPYCGIGTSGASELAAKIIDEFKGILFTKKLEYADDILNELRSCIKSRYDDWFEKFKPNDRPGLGFILTGFQRDTTDKLIPRTYFLASQTDFAP